MSLKKAYLYLVSVISLIIAVVGAIMLLNMALKTWVFTKADTLDYYYGPCMSRSVPVKIEGSIAGEPLECTADEKAIYEKEAKERRSSQKQRDAAQALAMLLVATPVWYFHWKMARKEV